MADIPPGLKPVSQYIAISKQFSKRDPVVSYYGLMYAVQQGISLGKKDEAAKAYLLKLMDQLEVKKAELKDEEALKDEEIAKTHLEEAALKVFDAADRKDRAAAYDVGVVKAFFMASRLFTILTQFGEVSEEISDKTKYAKYKATDINRCLNSGVTPTPGPPGGWSQGDEQEEDPSNEGGQPPDIGFNMGPPDTGGHPPYPGAQPVFPPPDDSSQFRPTPAPRRNIPSPNSSPVAQPRLQPIPTSSYNPPSSQPVPPPVTSNPPIPSQGVANLSATDISTVQKYCKYAISSLDYDDRTAAINYLEKSLRLLRTGKE